MGHVQQRVQVRDPEPAAAATEHRREVGPAHGGIAQRGTCCLAHGSLAYRGDPIGTGLVDPAQDRQRDERRRDSEQHGGASPADSGEHRRTEDRRHDGADVAAGDVRADREPAALGRELLRQQTVADRMLWRAADARDDVREAECRE